MKKTIYILLMTALLALCGCESYLDRQPDDQLTSENLFEKRTSTYKCLIDVYSHMFYYAETANSTNGGVHLSGSDECSVPYPNANDGNQRFYVAWCHGSMSPMYDNNAYVDDCYYRFYRGITNATYFMQNAQRCLELTDEEVTIWKAEARFCRAIFYFDMMRYFGPVVFTGEDIVDFNDPTLNTWDRSTWQFLVDWLCQECDLAAADLPDKWGSTDLGRATKGAALALKARLLTTSARPLFNGQNGTHIYDDMINVKGEKLFNTDYDENRWRLAAQACKDVIDMGQYKLENNADLSPLENYHNTFKKKISDEHIFVQMTTINLRQQTCPRGIGAGGRGGVALTQKMVDAFAMANGVYPIQNFGEESYKNGLNVVIDSRSGYDERGAQDFVNPFFATIPENKQTAPVKTMNMYVGREPRFYANVFWGGQTWVSQANSTKDIEFFANGNSGPGAGDNYPTTGYLPIKFCDPDLNTANKEYGSLAWPVIRYADILLMYVEALNEYDPTNADILKYWNEVRSRAGVPAIETVYPNIVGDKDLQRKYIHLERAVEFCFEGVRYYDNCQWMTAQLEHSGHVVGCNIAADNHDIGGDYWTRTSIFDHYGEGGQKTLRTFDLKHYLMPFNQTEMNRCPTITQNLGW